MTSNVKLRNSESFLNRDRSQLFTRYLVTEIHESQTKRSNQIRE